MPANTGPAESVSAQRVAPEHCGPVQIVEVRSSAAKKTETAMTLENVRKLHVLSRQLTEYLSELSDTHVRLWFWSEDCYHGGVSAIGWRAGCGRLSSQI